MGDWIEHELATAKFGTRKAGKVKASKRKTKAVNVRLKKRLQKVLKTMSEKPSLKFPAACNGSAEMKAAYRFVDNEHVTAISVLSPHYDATVERIRAQSVVLVPQDTTELDLTRRSEVMKGSGPLNDCERVGFFNHPCLAVTPLGLALGVVHAKIWARDFAEFEKDADQKRRERRAKAIRDKESIRWIEGYRAACWVAEQAPDTHIVSLADSEGDVFEYLLEAQPVEGKRKASFIIRACQNRAVVPDEACAQAPAYLRETVASTPILAKMTVEVRQRDGNSKDDRKRKQAREPRTATVTVQAARVTLRGPARPGGKLENVAVNAVLVTEVDPPPGAEPIEWLLLTDLPIDTAEEVLRVVEYYKVRWMIEIFFRILKSGCKVEESQLEEGARFEPYLALCMIVSWRIMYVMMLGRECPELPCDVVFDDDEWRAVYADVKKEPPPSQPPSTKTMVGMIASLGGWLGRKCDGELGPKAMWVGMQRMVDLARGWRARADYGVQVARSRGRGGRARADYGVDSPGSDVDSQRSRK